MVVRDLLTTSSPRVVEATGKAEAFQDRDRQEDGMVDSGKIL
jgi:hypothetical protein